MNKIKLVRIEKKKAFLIRCAIGIVSFLILLFIISNKVRIYNASGNMVVCYKKLPKKGDVICYKIGKIKKVAIFDGIRNNESYRLYSLDNNNIISEYVAYQNYKGIVKLTIPLVFTIMHSKVFLVILLFLLIFLYKKNEELHNRKINRRYKKKEVS